MLGRLLAGSGRFGDVTGLDVTLPGNTADVKLVYDMPTDAVPAILELCDSMF